MTRAHRSWKWLLLGLLALGPEAAAQPPAEQEPTFERRDDLVAKACLALGVEGFEPIPDRRHRRGRQFLIEQGGEVETL